MPDAVSVFSDPPAVRKTVTVSPTLAVLPEVGVTPITGKVGAVSSNVRPSVGPSAPTFPAGSVVCADNVNAPSAKSVCSNPARILTDILSAVSSPAVMVRVCGVLNDAPSSRISTISFSTAPFSPTVTSNPASSSAMLITGPSPSTSTTISGVTGAVLSIVSVSEPPSTLVPAPLPCVAFRVILSSAKSPSTKL